MFEVSLTSCFLTQDTELQLLKKGKYPGNHLETGEIQLQACSKRELQLENVFAEAQPNHATSCGRVFRV